MGHEIILLGTVNSGSADQLQLLGAKAKAATLYAAGNITALILPLEAQFIGHCPFPAAEVLCPHFQPGAALLANSEVAGGMFVFKTAGNNFTVVCKELQYKFLRPCMGPAVYRVKTNADLESLVAAGAEFNIDVVINIYQGLAKVGEKEKRVGRCYATFHVTPKTHIKGRKLRAKADKA